MDVVEVGYAVDVTELVGASVDVDEVGALVTVGSWDEGILEVVGV